MPAPVLPSQMSYVTPMPAGSEARELDSSILQTTW
jgi:hypothetical protein